MVSGKSHNQNNSDLNKKIEELERRIKELEQEKSEIEAVYEKKHEIAVNHLKFHVKNSPLGVIEWGSDRRISYWSKKAEEIFGWSEEEVLGKLIEELKWVHEDDILMVSRQTSELYTSSKRNNISINRNYRKDGSTLYCEWYNSVQVAEDGSPLSSQSLVLDVTARVKAEEELRKNEEKYRLISASSIDFIFSYDENGRFTSANKSLCNAMGAEESVLMGKTHEELGFPKEICEEWAELHKQVKKEGKTVVAITSVSMPATGPRNFEVLLNPLFDKSGRIIGISGVARDVTEKLISEQLLKESEERLNKAVSMFPLPVAIISDDDRVLNLSNGWLKASGYSRDDIKSLKDWLSYSLDDTSEEVMNEIFKIFEIKEIAFTNAKTVVTKKGEIRKWDFYAVPLGKDLNGRKLLLSVGVDITEQLKHEEELKNSEEKFRRAIENAPIPMAIFSQDGKIIQVSSGWEKYSGYTNEELPRVEDWGRLAYPDNWEERTQYFYRLFDLEGSYTNSDAVIVAKDGTKRVWDFHTTPIGRTAEGHKLLFTTANDVTERKAIEEELRKSEANYRLLAENSKDVIWIMNTEGRFTYCSPSVFELRGYTVDEVMQQTLNEALTPDSQVVAMQAMQETYDTLMAGGKVPNKIFMLEQPCKDGSTVWTEVTTNVLFDDNNVPIGFVGVTRNVTEKKEALDKLKESEAKFRSYIENANDVVFVMNKQGVFTYVAPNIERLLGYKFEEVINQKFDKYVHPDELEMLYEYLNELFTIPDLVKKIEYRIKKASGEYEWFSLNASILKSDDKSEPMFLGIARDINDIKIAENKLKEYSEELMLSNAAKDKFFSIISHDLRGPYHGLLGFTEYIYQNAKEIDRDSLELITGKLYRAVKTQYGLLNDLLDWSRMQNKDFKLNVEAIELNLIVNEVIESLSLAANQKGVYIFNTLQKDLVVNADPNMIKLVFRNLFTNGIKFSEKGATVETFSRTIDNYAEITVLDNGVGMLKEDMDKLFKDNIRHTTHGTNGEEGTGLGLLLCKEIIVKHGGSISVDSQPCKWTKFTFTVPLYTEL